MDPNPYESPTVPELRLPRLPWKVIRLIVFVTVAALSVIGFLISGFVPLSG